MDILSIGYFTQPSLYDPGTFSASTPYRNQILGTFYESTKDSLPTAGQNLIKPLSQRKLEVLQLLAGGYANNEIARQLLDHGSCAEAHR